MFRLRRFPVSSLRMFLLFSHRILYYGLISFRNAMQLYFLSSCLLQPIFLELVVKIFDYFWKPSSLFSKFCVNWLLMFYFVYCNNCVLNDVNGAVDAPARWLPWACLTYVSRLRRREKSSRFSRCIHVFHLVLKHGSDINEGSWLQLLFYLIVLIGIVVSVIGVSFLQLCFTF